MASSELEAFKAALTSLKDSVNAKECGTLNEKIEAVLTAAKPIQDKLTSGDLKESDEELSSIKSNLRLARNSISKACTSTNDPTKNTPKNNASKNNAANSNNPTNNAPKNNKPTNNTPKNNEPTNNAPKNNAATNKNAPKNNPTANQAGGKRRRTRKRRTLRRKM